jgi:hypothetical protein
MREANLLTVFILLSGLPICAHEDPDPASELAPKARGVEMVEEFNAMFAERLQEIILVPGDRIPNYEMIPLGLSRIRGDALKAVVASIEFEDPIDLGFHHHNSGYLYSCFLLRRDRGFQFEDEIILLATSRGIFVTFGDFHGYDRYMMIKGEAAEIFREAVRVRLRKRKRFSSIELPWSPLEGVVETDPYGKRSTGIVDKWPLE